MGEQAAAHADLAMDAPYGQFDSLLIECLLPGEDVLIDAVDQRAVEVEQEGGFNAHGVPPETGGDAAKSSMVHLCARGWARKFTARGWALANPRAAYRAGQARQMPMSPRMPRGTPLAALPCRSRELRVIEEIRQA
jgi:hypothetical protein